MALNQVENIADIAEVLRRSSLGTGTLNVTAGGIASDATATGTLTAAQAALNTPVAGGTVQLALAGFYGASAVLTGVGSNSVVFDTSSDGGTTWVPMTAVNAGTDQLTVTATADGSYLVIGTGGASHFRARCSAYVSGTVTVQLRATVGQVLADAVYPLNMEVTGSGAALNALVIPVTDVSNFRSVGIQFVSASFSGVVTFQVSNDGTNWTGLAVQSVSSIGTAPATTTGGSGQWHASFVARYLRAIVTTYTSGSISGTAEFNTFPITPNSIGVNGTVAVNGGSSTLAYASGSLGSSVFRNPNLSNTATTVKLTAGNLYGWNIGNGRVAGSLNSVPSYVHFYNALIGSVTVGTTVPAYSLMIPANGGDVEISDTPFINFGTAISVAVTTSPDGLTSTAPTNGLVAHVTYS